MAKCPECGKDIRSLLFTQSFTANISQVFEVFPDDGGLFPGQSPVPDQQYFKLHDSLGEAYHCPRCKELVTDDSEEAYKLLSGS